MRKLLISLIFVLFFMSEPAYGIGKIVKPYKPYTYSVLKEDLWQLRANYYRNLEIKTIGQTHFGRKIFAIRLGQGKKNIIIIGAHHGREWLTTSITMKMLEQYAEAYKNKRNIGPYSSSILDKVSIWFVPMLNPDGVTIQQGEVTRFPYFHRKRLLIMNENSSDFSRWKANGMGVDLNRQYPAGWKLLNEKPIFHAYQFYKGKRPLEAKEVQALVTFVDEMKPSAALAYHTSGQVIFWEYKNGPRTKRDKKLAEKVAELTGYSLSKPGKDATGGGFTDWFITTYKKPAMTIEISPLVENTNPPISDFNDEWKKNQFVGIMVADEVKKLLNEKK